MQHSSKVLGNDHDAVAKWYSFQVWFVVPIRAAHIPHQLPPNCGTVRCYGACRSFYHPLPPKEENDDVHPNRRKYEMLPEIGMNTLKCIKRVNSC